MAAVCYGRIFVALFIQLIFVTLTNCCVKKNVTYPPAEEMVYRSDYLLHGRVIRKITPDPRTPNIKTAYGIEFEIICIYKGDPTSDKLKEKNIIIAGAGVVDPNCFSLEVDEDEVYNVFLNDTGSHIVPTYGAPNDISVQDTGEITIVCDLNPRLPGGETPDPSVCPSSSKDCIKYIVPQQTTTVKVVKPPILLSTPTPEPTSEPKPSGGENTDKAPVKGAETKGQETKDGNNAAISTSLISVLSICLLSGLFLS